MNEIRKNGGITFVALVITIIIIIILATVAINFAFGDNGLITQAEKARDMAANSTVQEETAMNSMVDELANVMVENGEGDPTMPSTVADAIANNTQFTEKTDIADDLGNPLYIPGGFHIASDSGINVEDGIVIEDNLESKNQFVWIPVT